MSFKVTSAIIAISVICLATTASADVAESNLLVHLQSVPDADIGSLSSYALTTGSGTGGDPYKVMSWYDQVFTGGDAATMQDFGQDVESRRPSLVQQVMPNGSTYWVVTFEGGASEGNDTIDNERDYLQNKVSTAARTTDTGTEFNPGITFNSSNVYNSSTDPALGDDSVSWITVFRAQRDLSGQIILRTRVTGVQQLYSTEVQDRGEGDSGVGDVVSFGRDGGTAIFNNFGDYADTPADAWYIMASSYDPSAPIQAVQSVLIKQGDTTPSFLSGITDTHISDLTHRNSRLGLNSNGSTGNSAVFLNGQIAEVQI